MGLESAGMETVFQCEYDKHCLSVLERHWPDVPRWGDVSTLTGAYILKHAPVIDVVAWGSPCQDLSVAGKREGLDGKQSNLFHEGIRIIKELRELTNGQYPRISIWENVVGALTSNNGNDFGVILDEMAKAGALVQEWSVLDAQYFGIPQRRRRVFVVSVFDPTIANNCPDPILPVAQSVPGDSTTRKSKRERTPNTASKIVGDDHTQQRPILIDRAAFNQGVNALYEPYISDDPIGPSLVARGPHAIAVNVDDEFVLFENSYRDGVRVANDGVTQTLSAKMGTGGNNTPMITVAYSVREDAKANNFSATELDYANSLSALQPSTQSHHAQMFITEHVTFYDGYNQKLDDSGIYRSLRIGRDSGDFIAQSEQMAVRRLTPLECERLMGWPDNHTELRADETKQSDSARYKQCGNGIASPVARWIASKIISL